METLIADFIEVSNELSVEEAKIILGQLRMSLWSNREEGICDVHALNLRYAFSKRGKVPASVERWLQKVLEVRPSRDGWNEILKLIHCIAKGEKF